MRNFLLILILIIPFSCSLPSDNNFTFSNPKFNDMQEACEWINQNITYKKDFYDYWKMPQETLNDGDGDCEDQALLLMGIMKYQKDYDSELIIVQLDSSTTHAVVKFKNKYYDCTNGKSYGSGKYNIITTYNYDSAMNVAKYVKNY